MTDTAHRPDQHDELAEAWRMYLNADDPGHHAIVIALLDIAESLREIRRNTTPKGTCP